MRHILLRSLLMSLIVAATSACSAFFFAGPFNVAYSRHLRDAEEYSRQKEFDKAIESYQKHIHARLGVKERPEWENPFFYHIIIGDLQLGQEQVEAALASYELAEKHGVEPGFISDRYR
ncbi:hypothetical protein OAO01_06230, partial [Oligoflexia bacterium]|nr:hypothetical protein [Oligoflexia bacterium]